MNQPSSVTTRRFAVAFLAMALWLSATAVFAATWTVTSSGDMTPIAPAGTLRHAVEHAAADDTIEFALPAGAESIALLNQIEITKSLVIDGRNTGGSGTRITVEVTSPGASAYRILWFSGGASGELGLYALTLRGGDISANGGWVDSHGGVIYCASGSLYLREVTISDGKAVMGGGLCVNGSGDPHIRIGDCTFRNNVATGFGGGICLQGGDLVATRMTVNDNTAQDGGGLYLSGGQAVLVNSTIAANAASGNGGAIHATGPGKVEAAYTTIGANAAIFGGGVYVYDNANVALVNSIVINNMATASGRDFYYRGTLSLYLCRYAYCSGVGTRLGSSTSPNLTEIYSSSDLGSLADRGGFTRTMWVSGRVASAGMGTRTYYKDGEGFYFEDSEGTLTKLTGVGAYTRNAKNLISTDQRGVARRAPGTLGAYEAALPVIATAEPPAGSYKAGSVLNFTTSFWSPVVVDTAGGTPRLALTVGTSTKYATYAAGSGSDTLTFSYTVQSGDVDADGITVDSTSIELNGGTIVDDVGYAIDPAFLAMDTSGVRIDTTAPLAPVIVSASLSAIGGTAEAGSTVSVFDGTFLLGTVQASSSGLWTLPTTLTSGQVYRLCASAADEVGNVGALSGMRSVTLNGSQRWLVVSQQGDDGAVGGTLRNVLANAAAGDLIQFALKIGKETIVLDDQLVISKPLTIDGANPVSLGGSGRPVTIQVATPRTSAYRVFLSDPGAGGSVELCSLTLCGGQISGNGAVIDVATGSLSVVGSVVQNGRSDSAGGGVCVESGGSATFRDTTIRDNAAGSAGGGVSVVGGTATFRAVTIRDNTTGGSGGGISVDHGSASLTLVSVNGNSASTYGGGLSVFSGGRASLCSTTISGNLASGGGGVLTLGAGASTALLNTIVAANTAMFPEFNDVVTGDQANISAYFSWYGSATAYTGEASAPNVTTASSAGDMSSIAANGGATETMALSAFAPAVGQGTQVYHNATDGFYFVDTAGITHQLDNFASHPARADGDLIATDQRGVARGLPVTIGAFQAVAPVRVTAPAAGSYPAGSVLNLSVSFGDTVTVDTTGGTPRLALTVGSVTSYASYVAGSGTRTLLFAYTVPAGAADTDGLSLAAATIGLNGGRILDAVSYAASLALPVVDLSGVVIDTVEPAAPAIATAPATISTRRPGLSGTAESGSTVKVYDGATLVASVTADASGAWSYTPASDVAEGVHTFSITSTDAAGNTSPASGAVTVVIDTVAPAAPAIATAPATINTRRPGLSGTAESGSTVKVYDGATLVASVTADASGAWSHTPASDVAEGVHTFSITSTDAAGNTSPASGAVTVVIDTVAPAAPAIATAPATINTLRPGLSGTAESGSVVKVYDGATLVASVTADASGAWSYTPASDVAEGVHTFSITSTDAAGNTSPASGAVVIKIDAASRFSALSARAQAGTGEQTLILGFVFAGGGKPTLVRGVGPGLLKTEESLSGKELKDPQLRLFALQSDGKWGVPESNDDWDGSATMRAKFAALGLGALNVGSKDAAIYSTALMRTVYTAQVNGVGGTGVALAEAYDADFADKSKWLTALSVRNQVGTGADILIAGFVVSGTKSKRVIVRGVGPSLAKDVSTYLRDPQLALWKYDGSTWTLVGSNDDWVGSTESRAAFEAVGMGRLDAGSKDAALVITLEPGVYTAQVSGVGGTTGVGLVEIYEAAP